MSEKADLADAVRTVLKQEISRLFGESNPQSFNKNFLSQHSNSIPHRLAGKYISPEKYCVLLFKIKCMKYFIRFIAGKLQNSKSVLLLEWKCNFNTYSKHYLINLWVDFLHHNKFVPVFYAPLLFLLYLRYVVFGTTMMLRGTVFAKIVVMTKLTCSVFAAAKMMVYLEPSSEKIAYEIATALDESLSGKSIQVCGHSTIPSLLLTQANHQCVHTLQVCTEVLEALRKGHLGSDHQKAAEAYRVACHKIFPYSLSFLPPGYQDNTTAVSANGDMFTGEHNDLANEMWSLRTSSGALVHRPSPPRSPWAMTAVSCPPHCTDLDGWSEHRKDTKQSWHKEKNAYLF